MNDLRCNQIRPAMSALLLFSATAAFAAPRDYKPSPTQLLESYKRADTIVRDYASRAFKMRIEANWIDGGRRFWYRNDLPKGRKEFLLVDASTGAKTPAFDSSRLANALSGQNVKAQADALPFNLIDFVDGDKAIRFDIANQGYKCDLGTYELTKVPARPRRALPPSAPWTQDLWAPDDGIVDSPDHSWSARIRDDNVWVKQKDGQEFALTSLGRPNGYFSRIFWTPDSKRLVAVRVTPGDRKKVYLIESSPKDGGPAKLRERVYDRPGDKIDAFDMWILDPAAKSQIAVDAEPVDYGELPTPRWKRDQRHFTYEKMDRGYGRWRVIEVDSVTGKSRAIVDDDPPTFVDSTAQYTYFCRDTDEIVWRSERTGWGHLYLTDGEGNIENAITKGDWVVREVRDVDEKNRRILFTASGMNPGEDPYYLHFYRVNFDGTGLTCLTPSPGTHNAVFSPDGKTLVDTYSTIDTPPVHELRSAEDGHLIATLEKGDVSELKKIAWRAPEPFVAKGRDGKTDIYGVVYRPSNFDPHKRYPIIEDIYAGPQDSFVPKAFAPYSWDQPLAELGFVVVQIDGMGTRNRGKAFHDVCYKNIADAGFPDRILWMKALAAKYPQIDLARVGVFGTSAGGQSSTGALLFHPEFYKVAVSSCGCHDNRLDKLWWNEQWMGYPVGPEYAAQSNITNAAKLRGKLMLMVGELDSNVPPETTYRLADALIKANREFQLVVLPGLDHTSGGQFGERKRRDFFVKNLLGVDPPSWNDTAAAQ